MILGQSSVEGLDPKRIIELDLISVKGKKEPERIYTLMPENLDIPAEFIEEHGEFLKMYRSQNWQGVMAHIGKYREKLPFFNLYYDLISDRTEEYSQNPPPSDWQGVFVAKTK